MPKKFILDDIYSNEKLKTLFLASLRHRSLEKNVNFLLEVKTFENIPVANQSAKMKSYDAILNKYIKEGANQIKMGTAPFNGTLALQQLAKNGKNEIDLELLQVAAKQVEHDIKPVFDFFVFGVEKKFKDELEKLEEEIAKFDHQKEKGKLDKILNSFHQAQVDYQKLIGAKEYEEILKKTVSNGKLRRLKSIADLETKAAVDLKANAKANTLAIPPVKGSALAAIPLTLASLTARLSVVTKQKDDLSKNTYSTPRGGAGPSGPVFTPAAEQANQKAQHETVKKQLSREELQNIRNYSSGVKKALEELSSNPVVKNNIKNHWFLEVDVPHKTPINSSAFSAASSTSSPSTSKSSSKNLADMTESRDSLPIKLEKAKTAFETLDRALEETKIKGEHSYSEIQERFNRAVIAVNEVVPAIKPKFHYQDSTEDPSITEDFEDIQRNFTQQINDLEELGIPQEAKKLMDDKTRDILIGLSNGSNKSQMNISSNSSKKMK